MLPGQEHFAEKQHPQSQSPWPNKAYATTVCFLTSGATNFSFLDFMTWEIQGVGVFKPCLWKRHQLFHIKCSGFTSFPFASDSAGNVSPVCCSSTNSLHVLSHRETKAVILCLLNTNWFMHKGGCSKAHRTQQRLRRLWGKPSWDRNIFNDLGQSPWKTPGCSYTTSFLLLFLGLVLPEIS